MSSSHNADASTSGAEQNAERTGSSEANAASDIQQNVVAAAGGQGAPHSSAEAGPSTQSAYYPPSLSDFTGPVADSHNSSSNSDTDSAVGDFVSTRSQSLSESVFDFRNEHGRRYHAYRDGVEYQLPNDEQELDRLDLQHHLFYLTLRGKLQQSPLDELPYGVQNVLDIGTGTGIWAIDFADRYPTAKVIGTDLSPVQPVYVPPNCHFYVDDATADWNFDAPFDFIHGRMLVVAIKDWSALFRQCFDNLTPGGWVEFQDLNFPFRCDDGSAGPDSAALQWSYKFVEGAAKLGIDMTAPNKFAQQLAEVGFVDVQVERYVWPINRWPKDEHEKEKGLWMLQNMQEGLQGFSMGIFTKGLGWRAEEVEVFLAEVRRAFNNRKSHVYLPIWIVYARKPS
ncbi:S-adenosyl-L-methionine-dependent methyltransferase [Rhizodiscina lignyota]|uniref:S-adenosyl-L-methionine-dependent methyltransferase n=1 Tax=Rhizodiscina lignyota TaxID=1504668 RepID=A0A9P4IAU9_9PEZI|nr:S-adenosyl-L-methionine-dependent methyltransferase [Rhizodiscina lignyota]